MIPPFLALKLTFKNSNFLHSSSPCFRSDISIDDSYCYYERCFAAMMSDFYGVGYGGGREGELMAGWLVKSPPLDNKKPIFKPVTPVSTYSSIHVFIYSSIHLFIYSSIHLFIYLSIHLFIYLSINLFICSSIPLFI